MATIYDAVENINRLHIDSNNFDIDFDTADIMRDRHSADWQYEKIKEEIKEFENNLDDNTEISMQLASFGQSILINVRDIGYQNPDLFYIYGKVKGQPVQLIQHITQLSFLLTSSPKIDPYHPPHRIGFVDNER